MQPVLYVVQPRDDAPADVLAVLWERLTPPDTFKLGKIGEICVPDGTPPSDVESVVADACDGDTLRFSWFDVAAGGYFAGA